MCRHGMANRHCDDFTSVMSPAKHGQSTPRSTPFPSRMPQEGIVRCGMAEPAPVLDWRDEPHHLKALASLTSLISRTKPLARLVTPGDRSTFPSFPLPSGLVGPGHVQTDSGWSSFWAGTDVVVARQRDRWSKDLHLDKHHGMSRQEDTLAPVRLEPVGRCQC